MISLASIFLPRYSGVRPTISPPMNTANRTYTSIAYRPQPTPPQTTSLIARLVIGTALPNPVNDSIDALTEPLEVTLVVVAHSAELTIPLRCSLPSMFPPVEPAIACVLTPARCWAGVPCCSAT